MAVHIHCTVFRVQNFDYWSDQDRFGTNELKLVCPRHQNGNILRQKEGCVT